ANAPSLPVLERTDARYERRTTRPAWFANSVKFPATYSRLPARSRSSTRPASLLLGLQSEAGTCQPRTARWATWAPTDAGAGAARPAGAPAPCARPPGRRGRAGAPVPRHDPRPRGRGRVVAHPRAVPHAGGGAGRVDALLRAPPAVPRPDGGRRVLAGDD